jgi:hypothetical protein
MLIVDSKLVEIFCDCHDFCKFFEQWQKNRMISSGEKLKKPTRSPELHLSEIMCIMILYHPSGLKCFEYYYKDIVLKNMKDYFPKAPCYERFIQLIPRAIVALFLFVNFFRIGRAMGCFFADSKKLPVCNNLRIRSNKVFKGVASRSKSSTGWFYGLKLFLVINVCGEVMKCLITTAGIADNNFSMMKKMFKNLKGYAFADKGFLSQTAFEYFYQAGLKIVTTIRSNMKNKLMPMFDKLIRMKRGMIESVNDILMTVCDVDHSRHRSPINAIAHAYAGVAAYTYLDRLPSIWSRKFAIANP